MALSALCLNICIFMLLTSNVYVSKIQCMENAGIAKIGDVPFYALLSMPLFSDDPQYATRARRCGGSLIHPEWVLTAAHCFAGIPVDKIKKYATPSVFMGFNKTFDSHTVSNTIKNVIIHPEFINTSTNDPKNDVALVQLGEAYQINEYINVVLLPSQQVPTDTKRCKIGFIVGTGQIAWGNNTTADHLLYTDVAITEEDAMSIVFHSVALTYQGHVLPGDSGGPFFCYPEPFLNTVVVQYGIITKVTNKNVDGRLLITTYVNVERYMDFIRKYVPDIVEY